MRIAAIAAVGLLLIAASSASALVPVKPRPIYPEPAPGGYRWEYVPPVYRTEYVRTWVPGYSFWTWMWVEQGPGRMEKVWTEITVPGRYAMTPRQVLVRDGYWRLIRIDPVIIPPQPVPVPFNSTTVAPDGYAPGRPADDAHKFSPMTDWPK